MNLDNHAWRPDPEVEKRASVNSDVTTRQMTDEERAKYSGLKQTTDSNGKKIKRPNVGWRTNEKEYREMRTEMAKERKGKWDHVTKEFLEKEFAKGRTATEIEKQLGMPKSGIYNLMRKYEMTSPHGLKSKVKQSSKSAEVESLASEIVELNKQLGESKALVKELEEKLKVSDEETIRMIDDIKRLTKELDAAKGYADTAKIGNVDQVQEGNHIVIKIPVGKVVGE